jgi:hypothetical protein
VNSLLDYYSNLDAHSKMDSSIGVNNPCGRRNSAEVYQRGHPDDHYDPLRWYDYQRGSPHAENRGDNQNEPH